MSELFSSVKPGDTVHYLTQQGDARKGKVVMNRGTHLVINRGKGQPQVVNDKNYIKHERGGKVVGALLSRVHHVKEAAKMRVPRVTELPSNVPAIKKTPEQQGLIPSPAAMRAKAAYKLGEPQMNAAKAFGWVKEDSKLFGVVPFKKGDKSVADKVDHAYRKTFHKKRALDAIYRKLDRASAKTAERRAANKSPVEESVVGAVVGAGLVAAGAAGLYKNAKPKIKAYFKKKEAMKTGEKYAKQYAKDAAMYVANAKDPRRSKRSQSYHAKRAAEFIKRAHSEADKVSKLKTEATWQGAGDPYNWDPVMRAQIFKAAAEKNRTVQKSKGQPVPHELDTGRPLKSKPAPFRRGVKEETVNEVSKELAKRYVIAAVKDINYSSREAEGARTAAYADYMNKKAVKRSNAIAKNTKAMRAYKDHVFGKDIYKEDSKDAEGAAERVAKTKKHKKKLHEVSNTTLTNYVYKAIQDRKKSQIRARNAHLVHDPDRLGGADGERATAEYKQNKARADKRSAGIKRAVGKIASHLPAEPLKAHSDSESARHGGWSGMESLDEAKKKAKAVNWQTTQTKTFSVYKSTEGGMPLKHHMARLAAVGIPSRKAHSPYVGHTALEIPARHERKASKILYGENFDPSMINEVSAPGQESWIKANKQRFIDRYGKEKGLRVLYAKAWKMSKNEDVNEAAGKFTALRRQFTRNENQNRHTKNAHLLATHFGSEEEKGKAKDALARLEKHGHSMDMDFVYDMHNKYAHKMYEARENEYTANLQLAKAAKPTQKGHYLVRDGRKLSGPHSPEDAVKAYKGLAAQGTDTKGVKIVHVKETHVNDVTAELISEAKVKEAAKKVISLTKKAKGNKHVDTEPKLDIADKGTGGPMGGSHEEPEGSVNAKI